MPFQILGMWFRWLISLAILVSGLCLLKRGYDASLVDEPVPEAVVSAEPATIGEELPRASVSEHVADERHAPTRRIFRFDPGWNEQTAYFGGALVLLAWALLGGLISRCLSMLTLRSPASPGGAAPRAATAQPEEDPNFERSGAVHSIQRPDGSVLRVESYGPVNGPLIVWTHGWGADSTEWFYQKKAFANRYRLIVWDEPGLGLSKKPDNNDYRLENFAANLAAVLEFAGDRPAILAGHSIGGMTILTLCKTFPALLKRKVIGLILVHTTYTNPVRTTKMAALFTPLEKPVLIPLMYLTIAAWPLAWVLNWLSYINGSAQRSTHKSSFAGTETRGQLEFITKYQAKARPDVLARGMLGMTKYDATAALASIGVPALVIIGDKDTTTLPEAGQFIASAIPNAQLATLAPAKHMGLIEHHNRFNELVANFVDSCNRLPLR